MPEIYFFMLPGSIEIRHISQKMLNYKRGCVYLKFYRAVVCSVECIEQVMCIHACICNTANEYVSFQKTTPYSKNLKFAALYLHEGRTASKCV